MGRLDLADKPRDEDEHMARPGGKPRSRHRDRAEHTLHPQLVNICEAAFVVAESLDTLADRRAVRPETLKNLAAILRAGLRESGGS